MKYAVIVSFVFAAVLTPPDVISQVLLAVPLIILYVLGIGVAYLFARGETRTTSRRAAPHRRKFRCRVPPEDPVPWASPRRTSATHDTIHSEGRREGAPRHPRKESKLRKTPS